MSTSLRGVDDQIARLLELAAPLPPEQIPSPAGSGRVLAADLAALLPVPPFTNSAMDGFALAAADLAGRDDDLVLPVDGDTPAGAPPAVLTPGTAHRIMTGAPLPAGADSIVPVEHTDQEPGPADLPASIRIRTRPGPGRHVRRAGEDLAPGDPVLRAGTRLGPAHLAAAISVGHPTLTVHRRPRVAIITTGDELVDAAPELAPGDIPDSNGPLLAALAFETGAEIVGGRRADDSPEAFETALRQVLPDADLVLTSGGVSAGAFEVVRQALGAGGVEFVGLAMQPGKPQGWGTLDDGTGRAVPLLALPGNPVSSFVSFHVLARPLLAALAGTDPQDERATVPAVAGHGWTAPPGRQQYAPVALERDGDRLIARQPHRLGAGSHLIGSLHLADGLAVVPAEVAEVAAGDALEILPTGLTVHTNPYPRRGETW